jgi:hypothetical protein
MFLATYAAFTDSQTVFESLRLRFDVGGGDEPPQTRAYRRLRYVCAIFERFVTNIHPLYSILSAMKYWVASPYMPIESDVLEQIKKFANSVTSCQFMYEKATQIGEAIDGKVSALLHYLSHNLRGYADGGMPLAIRG